MTDYIVTDTELINVANAIRAKGGTVADLEWPSGYIAAINAIPTGGGGVTIVDWATGTDAEIVAMINAAHSGDIDLQQDGGWAVGDVRTISIGAFNAGGNVSIPAQTADIVISSFDDYMDCGCVMQFDFKESLSVGVRMNSANSNAGGYGSSEMKTTTLPALVNALPEWLKDLLIEFPVLASAGSKSTSIVTVSENKLALRSQAETGATASYGSSAPGEGNLVPFYSLTDARIKIKKGQSTQTQSNYTWWTRSPNYVGVNFMSIEMTGNASGANSTNNAGISPFGCI